ncbi:MAG: YicC/YloC family endoribonuclease [Paraperlucidibaca sp.]
MPVFSMTAFARTEAHGDFGHLSVELRSVNSRHLEATLRLPDALREHEYLWRERLRQRISRGKVELTLRLDASADMLTSVRVNTALAEQLIRAAEHINSLTRHSAPINPTDILALPGVVVRDSPDISALPSVASELIDTAVNDFLAMRAREGAALKALIEARLDGITQEIATVQARLPVIVQHYRDKLATRLSELQDSLVPERLEQELVLFVQKIDVAEELDRLTAHVNEIRRVLNSGGAIGRRLDFLMQELNREANTLGSKATTADSAWSSVELKVLVEQMREQVQNIE